MVYCTISIISDIRYALALSRDRLNYDPVPDILAEAVAFSELVPAEEDPS